MKYLKILIDPVKLKGDPDDRDQIQVDLYEHMQGLLDTESLGWDIDDNEDDEELDF